ncbi:MAG TPA: hypothetical protein VHC22_24095 [Pirellulales bacterium]|nr:hypothetical protein [Pirellulales bacterium]
MAECLKPAAREPTTSGDGLEIVPAPSSAALAQWLRLSGAYEPRDAPDATYAEVLGKKPDVQVFPLYRDCRADGDLSRNTSDDRLTELGEPVAASGELGALISLRVAAATALSISLKPDSEFAKLDYGQATKIIDAEINRLNKDLIATRQKVKTLVERRIGVIDARLDELHASRSSAHSVMLDDTVLELIDSEDTLARLEALQIQPAKLMAVTS